MTSFDAFLYGRRLAPTAPAYHLRFLGRGINVYDQAIRAEWAVRRIDKHWSEESEARHILIAGGGIAGSVAAVHAAKAGWTVTLVEPKELLATLVGSDRWVDAPAYLWPFPGWQLRSLSVGAFSFPWGCAGAFASEFVRQFRQHASGASIETLLGYRYLDGYGESDRRLLSTRLESVAKPQRVVNRSTNVLLVCSGLDTRKLRDETGEVTRVGRYRGPKFWETPAPTNEDSIVISGAGDGGLQDYLRCTLVGTIRDVLVAIEPDLRNVEMSVVSAERLALSWATWLGGADQAQRCAIEANLHERYSKIVGSLPESVDAKIEALIHPDVLNEKRKVRFLVRCSHFGHSYPINLLLAHLVDRCLRNRSRPLATVLFRSRAVAVDHDVPCRGQASCYREPVQVWWRSGSTCADPTSINGNLASARCDAVLIRHGLKLDVYDDIAARPAEIIPMEQWP